jgi:uncharacterized RmlC-like cupin family protein
MKKLCITAIALILQVSVPTFALAGDELRRLTTEELAALTGTDPGAGSSGVEGIRSIVLSGDPTGPGMYTIRVSVPANVSIAAHMHRDDRVVTVVSGVWYFGYGPRADASLLKELPHGSFYTEPGGVPHFAQTRSQAVIVHITGIGPTDTIYVDASADPRKR